MADCRECAGCLDVVEGVRILCVNSHVEPVTWAEALHDRCDDFRPKTAPVVDCRECVHVCDVVDGKSFRCSVIDQSQIPWRLVASDPCNEFRPKPAPASPPASADREGAEFFARMAKALRAGCDALGMHSPCRNNSCSDCSRAHKLMKEALAAITAGEATRRARPAVEDPRDALLKRCAKELEAATLRHWEQTGVGLRDHEQDCSECRPIYALLASLRAAGVEPAPPIYALLASLRAAGVEPAPPIYALLASLRAAGVEPSPEAQEGKASRTATVRHGETCEKAAHSGTGYLHDENDDGPYDVDGLPYCGRCHWSFDR